jgi:hypothetical protein
MHVTVLNCWPPARQWLLDYISLDLISFNTDGWFEQDHDYYHQRKIGATSHWHPTPYPLHALVAIEEPCKARIMQYKMQHATKVFMCPHVMTPELQKQLHKIADVVVTMPIGHHVGPKEIFESLLISVAFPFLKNVCIGADVTWLVKRWNLLGRLTLLCKHCKSCWNLESMSSIMVSKLLYFR